MATRQNRKIRFGDDASGGTVEEPGPTQKTPIKVPPKFLGRQKERMGKAPVTVEFGSDEENSEEENEKIATGRKPVDVRLLKQKAAKLLSVRESLPVYQVKNELLEQVRSAKVCVLIGETGSGKSTQIPQFLMDENNRGIAVTQPRRVAAINLATRVSEEYGCVLGREVGYSVRFNNVSSRQTKLKYITDGMLLRELMLDPLLSRYSTVIIDEAHERTILTDLLIGFLKDLVFNRRSEDDFQVIIMSATLDAERFSQFFNNAPIFFVEGRMYPVERYYLGQPVEDIVDTVVRTVVHLNQTEPTGDILCFLAGQEDIDKAVDTLDKLAPVLPKEAPILVPMPLYAALPSHVQMEVFRPVKTNQRKVILATNIAETSVTVPGIRYVVDSGLRKVKVWRHQLGLSTLLIAPISKASAAQRAGRAGREAPGKCYRLYRETDYFKLSNNTEPEILRSDVISPVLMLKKMGVNDILGWHWLENPGRESLVAALQQLYSLNALNDRGQITELGEKMVVLPVAPHLAAVLIRAHELGCLGPVIDIVACLSVDNLLMSPPSERRDEVNERRKDTCKLGTIYGDLLMLKELFDLYVSLADSTERKEWCKQLCINFKGFKDVLRVRRQIAEYMGMLKMHESDGSLDAKLVLKAFLCGFLTNTAIGMPDRSYRTVATGDLVSVHPSSLLFGQRKPAIMYIEYVYTVKGYARAVSTIELEWLQEVAPHLLGSREKIK
ncbi:hypothetical protein KL911_000515 [Ogataea haglerorum]|uniref:uncharacterized protein n=1 Tax=Ogataea haglerorum TaxID=1937702 RepID=UPI001C8949C5|nr:uncharacterized protein KL911_000515 [Ogataea haglerorum]KAG7759378.1 hypothetical protein KL911_000515 [Ogataea haglerorum]